MWGTHRLEAGTLEALSEFSLIIDGYYAQYACQFVVCAFTSFLLIRLGAWNPQPLMKWWGLAWAALAGYIACAGLGLYFVVSGFPAEDPRRIVLGGVALFCGWSHVVLFLLGWRDEKRGSQSFSPRRIVRWGVLLLCASLLLAVWLHLQGNTDIRFFLKVTLRGLLVFGAFSWVGVALLRYRQLMPLVRFWLGGALLLFALKHLHYAWLTLFGTRDRFLLEYYLQYIELALHTVMAAPVILWVCLGFVRQTHQQATELGRKDRLIERQDRLLEQRQRLASIGRMASGIAHDFNNILSVILGWTDIIRHGSEMDEVTQEGVEAIENAAQQAGDISKKLLLFGGNRQVRPTKVAVDEVLREAVGMVHGLRERRLSVEIDPGLPEAHADRALLLVSIQNLLINAVEATESTDSVSLRASVAAPGSEHCQLHGLDPGEYIRIEVRDTGSGIPLEILEQVYEPFFTTKERGTGLGLASVHGFLKQSGGGIDIDSEPGAGTRISCWLPVARLAMEEEPLEDSPARPADEAAPLEGGAGTIVVVDDELAIGRFVARVLTRVGHTVVRATSSDEALTECRRLGSELALLVSDVRMPGMSGPELAREVRRSCPEAGIIFVTGYAEDVDPGAIGGGRTPIVLQKPIMSLELLQAVDGQVLGS